MLYPSLLHFLVPVAPTTLSTTSITTRTSPHLPTSTSISPGCGRLPPPQVRPGGSTHNFTHFQVTSANGSTLHPLRAYSLSLPSTYDPSIPTPLILSFHGRGETNGDQEKQSNFSSPNVNKNAIAVFPMGINVGLSLSSSFSPFPSSLNPRAHPSPPSARMANRPSSLALNQRHSLHSLPPYPPSRPLLHLPLANLRLRKIEWRRDGSTARMQPHSL